MVRIAPSILGADFLRLGEAVEMLNRYADLIHLDVMDGGFVPNISFGFPVVEAVSQIAKIPMDAHLMIVNPGKYVERFAKVGVRMLSIHFEAIDDPVAMAELIRSHGMSPGLALNPDVPVGEIFQFLCEYDFIVLMSVFAGFGGQRFIDETYQRLQSIKAEILRQGVDCRVEIDGGVNRVNGRRLSDAGADILVAGSAVFSANDPAAEIAAIRG